MPEPPVVRTLGSVGEGSSAVMGRIAAAILGLLVLAHVAGYLAARYPQQVAGIVMLDTTSSA